MPSDGRQTASVMVRGDETLLLLDAGTGISNLGNYENMLVEYKTIHVFLSHYHLDHTIGIGYFCKWFQDKQIVFHTPPAAPPYNRGGNEVLRDLLNPESFALSLDEIAADISFKEYQERTVFEAGEFALEAKRQNHAGPSFAVKVNDLLCYATDTTPDATTFEWASGVDYMLHECWTERRDDSPHSSFEELVALSKILRNGTLCLVHQNPGISLQEYKRLCSGYPKIVPAEDLMEISL